MNLEKMTNIKPAVNELHSMESDLMRCQDTIEILKWNVSEALHNSEMLRLSLDLESDSRLFNSYTNLKYSCGNFDLHHKLIREIKDISDIVSDRMREVFDLLHSDLMKRANFDDKNLS